MTWRLPVFVLFWIARLAVFLPLAIAGIPIVYVLAHYCFCETRRSTQFDRNILQWRAPWLFGLWNNAEDGVDGLRGNDPAQQWWADRTASWSPQRRIFVWSALRNPVDSLRWVAILNPKLIPRDVRFVGMDHEPAKGEGGWFLAWIGLYAGFRFETKTHRLWIGWKVHPEDRNGLALDDARAIRCDFACQLKRVA